MINKIAIFFFFNLRKPLLVHIRLILFIFYNILNERMLRMTFNSIIYLICSFRIVVLNAIGNKSIFHFNVFFCMLFNRIYKCSVKIWNRIPRCTFIGRIFSLLWRKSTIFKYLLNVNIVKNIQSNLAIMNPRYIELSDIMNFLLVSSEPSYN